MTAAINILWFRQDLRITDNPALLAAMAASHSVLPIYILDNENAGEWQMGSASRWWLHHALADLDSSLKGQINLYCGKAETILSELCQRFTVNEIHTNRCYEPWRIKQDSQLKKYFNKHSVVFNSHNGSLLWEPWEVLKKDGTPYRVFTPYFKRGCLGAPKPEPPLGTPKLSSIVHDKAQSLPLAALKLLPSLNWADGFCQRFSPTRAAAVERLHAFLDEKLTDYAEARDIPCLNGTSELSPYLHFGQLSPGEVWHSAKEQRKSDGQDKFLSELGWREFSYYLLYHFPWLPEKNFNQRFDGFPWGNTSSLLTAWQQGKTGVPIVDAAQRELWQTGTMHNRMRMVSASFLIKHCLIDWRLGEKWFWDCLVDADLASNSASWQWVAGSGADASPYFRIFNPVTQAKKFDSDASYIKQYVPELNNLATPYVFAPWEAPSDILRQAGIELGRNYPLPVVELSAGRKRALEAYKSIKK